MSHAEGYSKNIEMLFEKWKSKPAQNGIDHAANVFVRDGIVCPEQWFSQQVRPLFLLKEAHGGDRSWDLIADHLLIPRKIKRGTWQRITEWTKGLLSTDLNHIEPYCVEDAMKYYGNPYLKQIAVVNVKKSGGTPSSNMACINEYAKVDAEELRREIEIIDPTVIICGYTISSLNIIMEREIKSKCSAAQKLYYHMSLNGHDVIVLDYWHPSNHYPDIMNYYGLMGIYQQALLNNEESANEY